MPKTRFPISLTTSMATYMLKKKIAGEKRFPLVLMLEPLHACNLTCTGCGRIREYSTSVKKTLTVDECMESVEECGAPIVSICGGEPLIYPHIVELVNRILDTKRHIYLCTNAVFLERELPKFRPTNRMFFNIHLDGMEESHDLAVERKGVFASAIKGLKAAKAAGFMVTSNTTVYKETDMAEIDELFAFLQDLGVDGHMLSPAYSYSAVDSKDIFMSRADIMEKFKDVDKLFRKYRLNTSPIYLEFLKGARELSCTAWGNPTRNIAGWKGPCYLITDEHHKSFKDLIEKTDWDKYGRGKDPRCEDCMVHCGYEPSAALGVNKKLGDTLKMALWQLT
ncbi:MAG TPA: adenosyl-hopene transferase HpnH [Armatimonadota bacterium]|jgi:hopanoid biosynthesis associated radical SAM protein HpnH